MLRENSNAFASKAELRAIFQAQVQAFRYQVLQPDEKEHSVYELDDAPNTLHLGAFINGDLASTATVCAQPMPNSSASDQWRLRGMATRDRFRGLGLGKRLVAGCLTHAQSQGASLVWCSARLSAVGFYRSLGFREIGEHFTLPEYSPEPYVLMEWNPPISAATI